MYRIKGNFLFSTRLTSSWWSIWEQLAGTGVWAARAICNWLYPPWWKVINDENDAGVSERRARHNNIHRVIGAAIMLPICCCWCDEWRGKHHSLEKRTQSSLFERETVESQGWNKKTTNRRLKVRLSRQRARGRESRQIMALSSSRVFLRGGWIALDGLPNRFVPYGVVSIPLDSWKMCDTRLFLVSKRANRKGLHSLNHGAALTSPSLAAWPYTFSPSLLCCQVASSQNKKVFFFFLVVSTVK